MNKIIGIYLIENKTNNKKYFGQSLDIKKRLYNHKYQLNKGIHHNVYLQSAWNKYGSDGFDMSLVIECDKKDLDELETRYIDENKTIDRSYGYNLCSGGKSPKEVSYETIKKLSESHLGQIWTPESRMKASKSQKIAQRGKIVSEDTKRKISKALTGIKLSKERIQKTINSLILRPKKSNTSSRHRGVSRTRHHWDARIKYKGKLYLLGEYETEEMAALSYNRFVIDNGFPHPLNEIKELV